jgi:hypothetical protein
MWYLKLPFFISYSDYFAMLIHIDALIYCKTLYLRFANQKHTTQKYTVIQAIVLGSVLQFQSTNRR